MEQQNPYSPPPEVMPAVSPARWILDPTVLFCAAFYTLAVVSGARAAIIEELTLSSLVIDVAMSLTLGLWATQDASRRGKPIPRSQQFWFLIFAIIVVPCYVMLTRGWKGLGWVMLHTVGMFIVVFVAMHVTGTLLYGAEWWYEGP